MMNKVNEMDRMMAEMTKKMNEFEKRCDLAQAKAQDILKKTQDLEPKEVKVGGFKRLFCRV